MESINQEDEVLSSLGSKDNIDKLQLDRYIEVLKIRRKEMDTGKKRVDLLTLTPSKVVWLMDAPWDEKAYSTPKVQTPSDKLLTSTPPPTQPALQFRYAASVESNVNKSNKHHQLVKNGFSDLTKEQGGRDQQ